MERRSGKGLEIDWGRVRDDERFDGKYVLLSNEMDLEAGELELGYRDMGRAERRNLTHRGLVPLRDQTILNA